MEKELIFHILQLSPTTDESAIQSAYRTLLKSTNPEDDPEGFKRLRQAYEEALTLSRTSNSQATDENPPQNEADLWISQVETLYLDITRRHRDDLWEELLSNPLCGGLDTSLEIRAKILEFLMNHIHLPHSIWKMIDETFLITENINTLKEQYPIRFLDYLKYYVENDTFLPYEYFTYENREEFDAEQGSPDQERNADAYIDTYLKIKNLLDNEQNEEAAQTLADIRVYGIHHPFEDVELLRLYLAEDKIDQAQLLARQLDELYSDNVYVRLFLGEAEWKFGHKDNANRLWESILAEIPDHYTAKLNTVRYLIDTKDYYNARERIMELLEVNTNDDRVDAFLKTANEALITEFRNTLAAGKEDSRLPGGMLVIELGWCLLQNNCGEEAIPLLENFTPAKNEEYSYHNLYGRLLHQHKKYNEALPHLEKWLELIQQLTCDGTAETAERMSRLPEAYFITGSCYYELGQSEAAIQALQDAVKTFPTSSNRRLECMHFLAHVFFTLRQYEKAIDICDNIIAVSEDYYPAYLIRQESFFNLKRAQQVIDDYYHAINIYPVYHRPYLFAAEVFITFGQYEDAADVFSRAKENQVEFSPRMKLLEVQLLRNLAESNEERNNALKLLDELTEELQKEKEPNENDIEDLSQITLEICLLHWDNNDFKKALEYIREALKEKPDDGRYHFICAGIHLDMKKYKKALEEYNLAAEAYQENPSLYFNMGLCYEEMNQQELALQQYKLALTKDEGYLKANIKLADYYEEIYEKYGRQEDFNRSIDFMSKTLAIYPDNPYLLIHRGLIYYNSLVIEPAMADFERLLELEPEHGWAWNNLACCYRTLNQFDKAISLYEKALSFMKYEEGSIPYDNMGDCYESLKNYEKAVDCYEKAVAIAPESIYYRERLAENLCYTGNYEKALEVYAKTRQSKDYYSNSGFVYLRQGMTKKCIIQYKKGQYLAASHADMVNATYNLAGLYADTLADYRKAVFHYKNAIRGCTDSYDLFTYEKSLAMVYLLWGKREKAKEHALLSLEHFRKSDSGTIDDYVAYRPYQPARAGMLGSIYMCLGDDQKAMYYFQMMGEVSRCKNCSYAKCYEQSLYIAEFYLSKGDLQNALAQYKEALNRYPHCLQASFQIERIKKKI